MRRRGKVESGRYYFKFYALYVVIIEIEVYIRGQNITSELWPKFLFGLERILRITANIGTKANPGNVSAQL